MRKIAIIKTYNQYSGYDDTDYQSSNTLISSISDWAEVTEEQFNSLVSSSYNHKNPFKVIEQIQDQETLIATTVKEYLDKIKKDKEREEKRREEYNNKKVKMALAKKQKMLAKLKAELEPNKEKL